MRPEYCLYSLERSTASHILIDQARSPQLSFAPRRRQMAPNTVALIAHDHQGDHTDTT